MGVAYYIELDNESLKIDHTDGKAVARAMDELNALAEELGERNGREPYLGAIRLN